MAAVSALVVLGACQASARAAPTVAPGSPETLDGPGSGVTSVNGLSIARDGSGAVVYLKQVSGVPHVFVSRLVGGAFRAPERLDGSLGGASSEPVVAAGNGGVLLVGFVNSGTLYVVDRLSASGPTPGPIGLAGGAAHPAIQMTNFGKAYLAFTLDAGGGNHDVRTAFYDKGRWALESPPLDAVGADDAGSGAGRPQVAAAGDGVGTVVWGEAGHVYSRRVWGTAPSVVVEQPDPGSVNGWNEVSSDSPVAGVGGDSSYVDVAFREVLSNGAQQQSRVFMRRLRGSQYDPDLTPADGLSTPGVEGGTQPQVALGEYGTGLATAARDATNQVYVTAIVGSGMAGSVGRLDSGTNASPPYAVPAMAGLYSDLVAWQHDPGLGRSREIRVRYASDGENFGPEITLSSPAQGASDAAGGLVAGGDVDGDAAVAWLQGSGGATRLMAARLFRAPGSFSPAASVSYSRSRHPLLQWDPPRGRWGPIRYQVTVDGSVVGQTTATSFTVPRSLRDGSHRWHVNATNPAGQQSVSSSARVLVDTVRPVAKLSLRGAGRARSAHFTYSDTPRGEPRANASGIASAVIQWGDGSTSKLRRATHSKTHAYRRPGRYRVRLVVKDRAGNQRVVVHFVRIR